MKRFGFGSGLVTIAVVVLLASLVAARATPRKNLLPRSLAAPPTVSTHQPTLAPPPQPSTLAAQATYEHHPRGQAISVRVEVERTP